MRDESRSIDFRLALPERKNILVAALFDLSAQELEKSKQQCVELFSLFLNSTDNSSMLNIVDTYLEALEVHTKEMRQLKKDLKQNEKKASKKVKKKVEKKTEKKTPKKAKKKVEKTEKKTPKKAKK
jgi:outer membrane biosynthesis protein TonB